jgi:hypothetical protein
MWDIFFTIRGPGGENEIPNNTNPVKCDNMSNVLKQLAQNIPTSIGGIDVEVTGIRVKKVKEKNNV